MGLLKSYDKTKNIMTLFFSLMLMCRFVSIYWVMPHVVDGTIFFIISAGALFFIGSDFIKNKNILKIENIVLLILFFVSCVISCLMFVRYGYLENLKALISIAVSLLFLYPFAEVTGQEKTRELIILFQKILITFWMTFAIISIGMFFVGYTSITYMHGTRILLGCIENRLFGMFSDPNYASVVSILTIIFSIAILNYKEQKKWMRIVCVSNIVVQYIYIVLGASRTGEVCLMLCVFFSCFVYSYKKKPGNKVYFLLIRILISLCVCLAVHYTIEYSRLLLSYIPPFFDNLFIDSSGSAEKSKFILRHISMDRPDVVESNDISNLRFRIWSSAMGIFKTTWLFGASPRNALIYAKEVLPKSFIVERGYDAHNFYVATLLYTGLSGAIFLGIFLIKSAFKIVMFYVKKCFVVKDVLLNSMVISTICIAISGFFVSEILFITTVGSFVFWLFLGYIMSMIRKSSSEDM